MKLNWKYRTDLSSSEWNSRVLESDECCFFQTHYWARVLQDWMHEYRVSTRVYERNGVEVLVPMMNVRGFGPFSSLRSMPRGTFGGLLSDHPLENEVVRSLLLEIVDSKTPYLRMCFSPLAKSFPRTDSSIVASVGHTHVLDLEGGFEHVWRNHFTGKKRNSILSARKRGVQIENCHSLSDVASCYRVYLDLVERRRMISHAPLSLFESIYRLIPTGLVDFLLAEINGQVVGWLICFSFGTYTNAFLSACLSEYLRFNVSSLLLCTAIEHAIDTGCTHFDFGESLGLHGLEFFKEQFGATRKVLHRVDVYSPKMRWAILLYSKGKELAILRTRTCTRATTPKANNGGQEEY